MKTEHKVIAVIVALALLRGRGKGPAVSSIDWTTILDRYRGQIPMDLLQRWLARESGGNPCAIGMWGGPWEAGIGQAYYRDIAETVHGATMAELRGMCSVSNPREMVRPPTAAELATHARQLVRMVSSDLAKARSALTAAGVAGWSEPDVQALAKLLHNLPLLVRVVPPAASSWDAYRAVVGSLTAAELREMASRAGYEGARLASYQPKIGALLDLAQEVGRGY